MLRLASFLCPEKNFHNFSLENVTLLGIPGMGNSCFCFSNIYALAKSSNYENQSSLTFYF